MLNTLRIWIAEMKRNGVDTMTYWRKNNGGSYIHFIKTGVAYFTTSQIRLPQLTT